MITTTTEKQSDEQIIILKNILDEIKNINIDKTNFNLFINKKSKKEGEKK